MHGFPNVRVLGCEIVNVLGILGIVILKQSKHLPSINLFNTKIPVGRKLAIENVNRSQNAISGIDHNNIYCIGIC